MKRSIEMTEFDPAAKKIKQEAPAPFIFDDVNYCACAMCGNKTQKPPLSQIITEWFMNSKRYLAEPAVGDPSRLSNLYKLFTPELPRYFVRDYFLPIFSAKYNSEAHPHHILPVINHLPKHAQYALFSVSDGLWTPSTVSSYPNRTYELTDGTYLLKTGLHLELDNCLNNPPEDRVVNNNHCVLRIGDMLTSMISSRYNQELDRVVPINTEFLPFNLTCTLLQSGRCVASTAWFKNNFFNKVLSDKLCDLNVTPDWMAQGLMDMWNPATGKIRTTSVCISGVCEDKFDFVCKGGGILPIYHRDELKRLLDIRAKYEYFIQDCTFDDTSYNNDRFKTNLLNEVTFALKTHDETTYMNGEIGTVIPQSFVVNHSLKDFVHLPIYVDRVYGDMGSCELVTASEADVGVFKVTDPNNNAQRVKEVLVNKLKDHHVITHIMWTSNRSNDRGVVLPEDYKIMHSYLKRSGDSWGTHRIYCHDCAKHMKKSIPFLFTHGAAGSYGHTNPVNYNVFYELYRALPMKLRPSQIDTKYNDIDIVCQ